MSFLMFVHNQFEKFTLHINYTACSLMAPKASAV